MFLKEELNMVNQKMEREREESRRRIAEKDKLLSKRALQINTLQGMKNNSTVKAETQHKSQSNFQTLKLFILLFVL